MNKFAKYVPEEDKKKQREYIGAMGLADMPFGETPDLHITWDGVVGDRTVVEIMGAPLAVKLSDETPTLDQLKNGTHIFYKLDYGYETRPIILDDEALSEMEELGMITSKYIMCPGSVLVAYEDNVTMTVGEMSVTVPEKGLYMEIDNDGSAYVSEVNIPGAIKTIDPKYLPSGVGGMRIIVTEEYDESTATTTYSADKTFDEITDAVLAGVSPHCVLYGGVFHLLYSEILMDVIQHVAVAPSHEFARQTSDGFSVIRFIRFGDGDVVEFEALSY